MAIEPTPQERQQRGFEFLRDQARVAHTEGDGLRVAYLCETALQEIGRLVNRGQLLVALPELLWAFSFQLFWLTSYTSIIFSRDTLNKVPRRTELDEHVFQVLQSYSFFVEQPLISGAETLARMRSIPIAALGETATPETAELVVHLLELAWFHLVGANQWEEIATLWLSSGTDWMKKLLQPVRQRLQLQARLTVPSRDRPRLQLSHRDQLRQISQLAELWLLHLHGATDAIAARIREIRPHVNPDDHKWRAIADFWHTNPTIGSTGGDDQSAWLARRRRMTADFPVLIFHDQRELKMEALLSEVYRKDEMAAASQRWEILQLAMLHELAALRMWDFWMWREAASAQSEALLEANRWQAEPGWTAQGLVDGVRATSLKSSGNDRVVRMAVKRMEFANEELLSNLASDLFATYFRQKHTAATLLEDIGDLVPAREWGGYATWIASYARESRKNPVGGFKMNPLANWEELFPLVATDSPVWKTLQGEVLELARVQHCWRSDGRAILWSWLNWAPMGAARDIGEAMIGVRSPDLAESLSRAEIIVRAEATRRDLHGMFTNRLLEVATLLEEKLLLSRHLAGDQVNALEEEVRQKTLDALRRAISQAAPPQETNQFSFGMYVPGLSLVHAWKEEDQAVLQQFIDTVNSERVFQNWLPFLLSTIQSFVYDGPVSFAHLVRPYVDRWAQLTPTGRPTPGPASGPFSIFQTSDMGSGVVAKMVGWICFQLLRRLGAEAHPLVNKWIYNSLSSGELEPTALGFYTAVVVATQRQHGTGISEFAAADAILLTLRIRMGDSQEASRSLAEALQYLAGILRNDTNKIVDWGTEPGSTTLVWLVKTLSHHAPLLAKATDPEVRANLAILLWNLTTRQEDLPPVLAEILTQLGGDARARVRLNAAGGINERRRQAQASD